MNVRPIVRPMVRAMTRGLVPGSSFDPLSLFANGEQGAWYDPSDLATLFQDAAGTTPVAADGDPVGLMLDKSGNDNHATQSTTSAKPIYRTDGVLHWLEFDGASKFMVIPNINSVFDTSDYAVIAGHYANTQDAMAIVASGLDLSDSMVLQTRGASNLISYRYETGSWLSRLDAPVLGRRYITTATRRANLVELRQDAESQDLVTATGRTITNSDFYIGRRPAGVISYLNGGVSGLVIVADACPDEASVFRAEQYIGAKSGVAL